MFICVSENATVSFLCSKQGLVQGKVWFLVAVSTPAYSVAHITCFPSACFESCWTPRHLQFTRILSSWGITYTTCKQSGKEQLWIFISYISSLLTSMLHCPIRFCLSNTSSKIKIIKNLEMITTHETGLVYKTGWWHFHRTQKRE